MEALLFILDAVVITVAVVMSLRDERVLRWKDQTSIFRFPDPEAGVPSAPNAKRRGPAGRSPRGTGRPRRPTGV